MVKYIVVIGAVILALSIRGFFISMYNVPTNSMAPRLMTGDYVLSSQLSYKFKIPLIDSDFDLVPKTNSFVVYVKSSKVFIRRVLAGPGDTFELQDGILNVNSLDCKYGDSLQIATENPQVFLKDQTETCGVVSRRIWQADSAAAGPDNWPVTRLAEGQFLVGSDNRTRENNQQVIDVICFDQIIGKPVLIWMSYSSTQDFISGTKGVRWNRILTKLN